MVQWVTTHLFGIGLTITEIFSSFIEIGHDPKADLPRVWGPSPRGVQSHCGGGGGVGLV